MNNKKVVRFTPNPSTGLSSKQVEQRIKDGDYNKASNLKTKSFPAILRDNVCTLFNLINLLLAVAVFLVGSYKNMLQPQEKL